MITPNALEATAIAKALSQAGQGALAAKWKTEADRLVTLEAARRKYIEAAGIVANLGAHVEEQAKDRGLTLGEVAARCGIPASGVSALRAGKNITPAATVKVLRWLGSTAS